MTVAKEIVSLVNSLTKLLDKWLSGTKGRRTRAALIAAQSALKRAEKLNPEIKDDKTYKKYRKKFDKNKIRK